jgi:hypothetical protein
MLADSQLSKFFFEYGIVAQALVIILVFAKCPTLVCASLSFLVASSILVFYPIDTLSFKLLHFSQLCERKNLEAHWRIFTFFDKLQTQIFIEKIGDRRQTLLFLFRKILKLTGLALNQLLIDAGRLEKWSENFLRSNLLLPNKVLVRKLNEHFKELAVIIEESKFMLSSEENIISNFRDLSLKFEEGCKEALTFVEGICCMVFLMTFLSIIQGIFFIYAHKFSK